MGTENSTSGDNIRKTGYVLKHDVEGKQLRRYFAVLTDHSLNLYEDESGKNKQNMIDLTRFSDVGMSPNGISNRSQLKLLTEDRQNPLLFLVSSIDINDWFKHIRSVISDNACNDESLNNNEMEMKSTFYHQHICIGNDLFENKSSDELRFEDESNYQQIEEMKHKINEKDKELSHLKMKILELENEKLKREKNEALDIAQRIKKKAEEEQKKSIQKDKEIEVLRQESEFVILWQWKENNDEWISYSNEMSKKIEKLAINDCIRYDSYKNGQHYFIRKTGERTGDQINLKTNKKREIQRVKQKITALILEKDKLKEKAEDIGYIIKWQWDETPWNKNKATWRFFDDEISEKIEALYINDSFEFRYGNFRIYKVTKKTKNTAFQINISSKVQRGCRRVRKKVKNILNEAQKYKLKAAEEEKKAEQKENEYNNFKEKVGYKVVWEVVNNNNIWSPFADHLSNQIEALDIRKYFLFSNNKYRITRISVDEAIEASLMSGKQWRCRRIEKAAGLNQVEYPKWWGATEQLNSITPGYIQPELIDLDLEGVHGKKVVDIFNKRSIGYEVMEVEGIKNAMLYDKYWNERQSVIKAVGKDRLNETYLFHGTRTMEVMDSVMLQGFRKEFNKSSRWGQGTYFAINASYSIKYSAQSMYEGENKMFLCKVICGESAPGNNKYELTSWPQKSNGLIYDSLVDNMQNAKIFVIHENVRAYPMYIIHFKKQ